jgi:signal transduction histidine kinase
MRRASLGFQAFLAILGVSLGTAAVVGLFARGALARAFDRYLASLPAGMPGRPRMGRMMLGAAEQAFVASVDRGVMGAALLAVAVAAVVAIALAVYLTRPLQRLEGAANGLASGDLTRRVTVDGPAEVAALGEAFNHMADSLERAEALRRNMVADVAHELRNPLAAARAQAEGMAEGVLAADPARLGSLVEDLEHLTNLVNDLQELAIAEAGRLHYEMSEVDLADLAAREAERGAALLRPGVTMIAPDHTQRVVVMGDERRLGQVLRNLISNAARHTASGSVTVSVESVGDNAEVRVIDTGQGMSRAELSLIFERFYRADAARSSDTGGAGLGLAISRAIVVDHSGEVFASSEPGRGTTVGFRLPARPLT